MIEAVVAKIIVKAIGAKVIGGQHCFFMGRKANYMGISFWCEKDNALHGSRSLGMYRKNADAAQWF
ncbi:TPA: hypothetical protein ACGIK9_003351 [Acinetobacter baumannii]|uniref:hypothetical protein n=1 Tax=Acinetobacter baumannii TaxID=470 RepID=UPI00338DB0A4